MAIKWRSTEKNQGRGVSALLLDFVFGDPMPQPEVVVRDDEPAWQDWLNALADQQAVVAFEDTRPTPRSIN